VTAVADNISTLGVEEIADLVSASNDARALESRLFLPYQRAWIREGAKLAILEKSRRIGADYTDAWAAVSSRITGARTEDLWYSSADETAAREYMEYIAHFCRAFGAMVEAFDESHEMFGADDITVFRAVLPRVTTRTGARVRPKIHALTSNPRTFRSKGGDVTLSEFAFHADPRGMMKAAGPATTWGGRVRVISTHHGEGSKFNDFIEMGRRCVAGEARPSDMPWFVHRVTLDDAIAQGLVELINATRGTRYSRDEFRAECRALCETEDEFNEEYLCEPSAQGGSYLPYELLRPCVHAKAPTPTEEWSEFLANISERSAECSALYAGVDVGRTTDRYVVWVIGKIGGALRTLGVLVWQGRSYGEMQMIGESLLAATFPGAARVRRLCGDATGIGAQMTEAWTRKFRGRAENVTITSSVKQALIPLVRRHVEERTITLPDDPVTLADLSSVRKSVTIAGHVRYAADRTRDGHADRLIALSLALHAADTTRACRFASLRHKPVGL